ncbi:MAG: Nramp family divalent metal transporter [Armatimonadota bacterium]|nr:Nramp family divalent metal transporter [Armatimonadota bacterium]MDR7451265.1 Nramp family divalent metal transporter [Armatimonadota bacterium]MDR7466832.1 Nramp family divalent metal transporter [Armatimonadota bacterium]MDR7492695.1 Nramp family divalent metal transporter [Armatimonadota bacterium]MDR7499624.1 Nramp family divalent metal transporter [Armatimonadota bacterium]
MRRWLRGRATRLLAFLAVMGPGVITGNVDNDANGIATYSIAGAHFGYALLWTLLVSTAALALVQEMVARMGAVTGKGLADLIRERFRVRATVFVMAVLVLANWANTVGDFAGIAGAAEIFGVSRYVAVPASAVLVWQLLVRGTYRVVERVFLAASLVFVTYVISALLARPPWPEVLRAVVTPHWQWDRSYVALVIGLIGTTIAPWMQFYQQAAVVDKGIGAQDYRYARLDTFLGVISLNIVAFFIVVACGATLFIQGVAIRDAVDAARALAPLAGRYASALFAIGLLNAGLFSVAIIPLSTAYAVCEAFGWEAGLDRSPREAPVFVGLFTGLIAASALVILIPGVPLISVMLVSQVLNGMLLPVVLVFLILLAADGEVMGRYRNSRLLSVLSWTLVVVLGVLSFLLVFTAFLR